MERWSRIISTYFLSSILLEVTLGLEVTSDPLLKTRITFLYLWIFNLRNQTFNVIYYFKSKRVVYSYNLLQNNLLQYKNTSKRIPSNLFSLCHKGVPLYMLMFPKKTSPSVTKERNTKSCEHLIQCWRNNRKHHLLPNEWWWYFYLSYYKWCRRIRSRPSSSCSQKSLSKKSSWHLPFQTGAKCTALLFCPKLNGNIW